MLASLGYQPVATTNGEEGLKLFREDPDRFALVITDQVMPNISGIDLARQLHALRPQLRILICSGFAENLPAEQARAFGVVAVLRKPVAKRQLADAIRKALDTGAVTPAG